MSRAVIDTEAGPGTTRVVADLERRIADVEIEATNPNRGEGPVGNVSVDSDRVDDLPLVQGVETQIVKARIRPENTNYILAALTLAMEVEGAGGQNSTVKFRLYVEGNLLRDVDDVGRVDSERDGVSIISFFGPGRRNRDIEFIVTAEWISGGTSVTLVNRAFLLWEMR